MLCVIPCLPKELRAETLHSVFCQTVPVEYVLLLNKRCSEEFVPQRVSAVLNDAVPSLRLEYFDWLLRLDADTVLPCDFVERNVGLGADVVGQNGYAMLVRLSVFMRFMGGKFSRWSDDTYTFFKLRSCGCRCVENAVPVKYRDSCVKHDSFGYWFYGGVQNYMMGYDPVRVLSWPFRCLLRGDFVGVRRVVFRCVGYFWALLCGHEVFDFAGGERLRYIHRLFRRKK